MSLYPKLETCGIFLQDFEPYSSEQGDLIHELIDHLQLKQTRPQSLIVKNDVEVRLLPECPCHFWKRYVLNNTFVGNPY